LQCKREAVGETNGAGYVEHCPKVSQIADYAVNGTTVELNGSSFQHTIANGRAAPPSVPLMKAAAEVGVGDGLLPWA
jgi:hypothetical protein